MTISKAELKLTKTFRDEVQRMIRSHNRRAHGRNGRYAHRLCALETTRDREGVILLAFANLAELGFKLKKPGNLAEKHVNALARHWQEKGLADRTLYKRMSMIRQFSIWIGKDGLVKNTIHYYGPEMIRNVCATKNLSWEAHGIDVEGAIVRATAMDELFGLLLSMQRFFGLRVKESLHLVPRLAIAPGEGALMVSDGTKGGRPRFVPVETDRQREVLRWAQDYVTRAPRKDLRWRAMDWKQCQSKFYRLMSALVGTLENKNVTAHGLRHGYAQDTYRGITGLPTPIEGGALGQIDRETHREANEEVSRRLGHNREDVVGFYYGSYGHKLRESRMDRMLRQVEKIELPTKKPPRAKPVKPTSEGA